MHILHNILYTFPSVLEKRICDLNMWLVVEQKLDTGYS